MDHRLSTKPMSKSDLEDVLSWAAGEGWNPGIVDAEPFYASDPEGFFLTKVEGMPVASVSVVNHTPEYSFLGLYICRPGWRGQGLGFATWQAGIQHAGSRTIGLDGVPEQEHNYRASGFVKTGSSIRYEGRIEAASPSNVRSVQSGDASSILKLDAQANGFSRSKFLHSWLRTIHQMRGTTVLMREGTIAGFATWRACRVGTKIGPIIAPDVSSALELTADIASNRSEGPLIIDVPEGNSELRDELESAGFSVSFQTARMYRGRPPESGASLQAIATMELG